MLNFLAENALYSTMYDVNMLRLILDPVQPCMKRRGRQWIKSEMNRWTNLIITRLPGTVEKIDGAIHISLQALVMHEFSQSSDDTI